MNQQYVVVDKFSGEALTRATKTIYKNGRTASRAVDRLDNEYGSYRYRRMLYSEWIEKTTPKASNVIFVRFG